MIKLKDLLESEHRDVVSIFESPMKVNFNWNPDQLSSFGKNTSFTIGVKEKATPLDKFENYELFEYKVSDNIINVLVHEMSTVAFFQYTTKNEVVEMNNVWQEATHIGLCRKFIFDYLLKRYKGITSNDQHTELGGKYWKKLIQQSQENNYKTFVVIKDKEQIPLNNIEDIDKFYFDSPKGLEYKFLISK